METETTSQTKNLNSTKVLSLVETISFSLSHKNELVSFLLLIAGGSLWFVSLAGINLDEMNDLGLVSVMTPGSLIALFLLTVSFALTIKRQKPVAILALLQLAVLLFALHSLTALVEPLARFGPAWRHVGVIDYIVRNGSVNPAIDAYFNWPGFFGLGAFLTEAAGLNNALVFLPWTSLIFELLYMFPIWIIYNSLSDDPRLVWSGLWIFSLSNWVGQDYFSPQGLNYFFYLVVLAILLKWFQTNSIENFPGIVIKILQKMGWLYRFIERLRVSKAITNRTATRAQLNLLLIIIVVIYTAVVGSHQLTPFAILVSVSALVLTSRISPRGLPILMLVLLGTWISYMTSAFMSGRIEILLGQAGHVDQMLKANLVDHMLGSQGHQIVVLVRLLLTSGLWIAAFAGGVSRWHAGYTDTILIILSLSPFLLLGMQAYGGEMLLRVFLFSLPFVAFLAAAFFFQKPALKIGWIPVFSFGLITLSMTFGFLMVRFGNERMESFTLAEQEAVQHMYEIAPEGSLIASSTTNMPYKYKDYEKYHYALFDAEILNKDVNAIITKMSDSRYKASFLIITRAQKAQLEMFHSYTEEDIASFQKTLMATGRFQLIYRNEDADIYQLLRKGTKP